MGMGLVGPNSIMVVYMNPLGKGPNVRAQSFSTLSRVVYPSPPKRLRVCKSRVQGRGGSKSPTVSIGVIPLGFPRPLEIRVPLFLLVGFNRGTQKQKSATGSYSET